MAYAGGCSSPAVDCNNLRMMKKMEKVVERKRDPKKSDADENQEQNHGLVYRTFPNLRLSNLEDHAVSQK